MATQLNYSRVERPRLDEDTRPVNRNLETLNKFDRNALDKIGVKDVKKFFVDVYEIVGAEPVKLPQFPIILFNMVLLKDVLDIIEAAGHLTAVGGVLVFILKIVLWPTLFIWYWGKTSVGKWREKLLRLVITTFILGTIPFVSAITPESLLILIVHFRETKIIKLYNRAADELKRSGALRVVLEEMD